MNPTEVYISFSLISTIYLMGVDKARNTIKFATEIAAVKVKRKTKV